MPKQELLATIRDRYQAPSRKDESRILNEFIAITGHHRKHGIRLLGHYSDAVNQVSVFEVKPFLWDCQDLWSRVLWHPRRLSASYCVELEQYLAHHRYHCNVPRLSTLTKSVIKPTHFAVVADDRPRAHVQRSSHQSPVTPDSPMPSLLAAVSGPGRQSHQGGQSLAIPVAQFGKVSHQGCRG